MTITPTEAEVILDAIESALIDVHTMLPGKIESYNADKQTANVQLQVKRALPKADGSYATEPLPVLQNIPVHFPRSNGAMLLFPLSKGDFGSVIFSEMSLDQWRSKAVLTSPGDVGRHTLTGGVFHPGLMPNSEAIDDEADLANDVVLGFKGGAQMRAKPGGTIEAVAGGPAGGSADDFVTMASKLLTALGVASDAAVVAAVPNDGGKIAFGAFKTSIQAADVASSNLKADE